MGSLTKHSEITSTIRPAKHSEITSTKMFKAFRRDSDEIFSKDLLQAFKSIKLIEGDGRASSSKISFAEADKVKYRRHRVDKKTEYHYSKGDTRMHVIETVSHVTEEHHHHHCRGSEWKRTTKSSVVAKREDGKEKANQAPRQGRGGLRPGQHVKRSN